MSESENMRMCTQHMRLRMIGNKFYSINSRRNVYDYCKGFANAFYVKRLITKEELKTIKERLKEYLYYDRRI